MEGVFTAIVTPFDKKGEIDREAFLRLVRMQEQAKISGLVIAGTTGEGWSLSEEEIEILYTLARNNFSRKIIIGTGAISTKKTKEKTLQAKNLGADAALVVVPYYNLPTEEAVVDHYTQVAKVGIPIIVYHHPKRTGVCLSIECLERIAKIDGVIAIKETVSNVEYYQRLSKTTDIFSGNDGEMKKAKQHGAIGVISVISNIYPEETKRFFSSKAVDSHWNLASLIMELFKEGNPAGVKGALMKKKYCHEYVRAPLLSLSEKGIERIHKVLNENFFKEIANK